MRGEVNALRSTNPTSNASRDAYSRAFFPVVFYNQKTFPRERNFVSWRAIVGGMKDFTDDMLSTSATSWRWLPHALQQRASSLLQSGAAITSTGSMDGLPAAPALKRYVP